jgi:uncharacterized protein YndB with AHSA1/START domain
MSNESISKVQVSKSFPASKADLYKAWTDPEQLKQWWKPMNKQLTNVENDIREGGKVVYEFEDNLRIAGEYKEVAEEQRLVYSWNWELPEESTHKGEYLLTVQFSETGNESTLDITQENFHHEHAIKPHEEGWDNALEDLKNHLTHVVAS